MLPIGIDEWINQGKKYKYFDYYFDKYMKTCERCHSSNIVGIEYDYLSPHHYDGISEWRCQDCGYRINRFTGQELKDGEIAKWHD